MLGTTTADRKLSELGHIAPVHSTPCVRYADRLLAQNTIYFVDKSLLNIKLHLLTWQQLTDCETSVNPDQRFCCWMPCAYRALAAAHVWLGRTWAVANCQQQRQHGANFAGCADGSNMVLYLVLFLMTRWVNDIKLEICFYGWKHCM